MTAVTSPLVAAYLADLERRLAGAPAADRLDVLDAVREHLDTAFADLGHAPGDDDVRRVLADLGSPDDVAGALALDAPPAGGDPSPRTSGVVWVLLVLAGLPAGLLVGLLLLPLALVHPVVLLGGLAALVGATLWVGYRAHGRRAAQPRRPWQLAFAVVLPAAVIAGTWALASAAFLTFESDAVQSVSVTSVATP
ncbi:hypothetical protein H9657_13245 [Cellulomonas sp. Sa3CUA2]|uniref:DUF1700 domain-containing protein n=1 Tax=Cellulomonas avistercoris TaxID=2762242 RepID=A0ABR8QFN1_9CELL|nr:hypothetical protein [Cellulomonas avistercoris]MBD7919236.1 hypothetical protein [Cellulomonas avistercoris]